MYILGIKYNSTAYSRIDSLHSKLHRTEETICIKKMHIAFWLKKKRKKKHDTGQEQILIRGWLDVSTNVFLMPICTGTLEIVPSCDGERERLFVDGCPATGRRAVEGVARLLPEDSRARLRRARDPPEEKRLRSSRKRDVSSQGVWPMFILRIVIILLLLFL